MTAAKTKAITFSYDDGTTQDIRLIEIFNKYNLKATFNLNSELLGLPGELIREEKRIAHDKVKKENVRHIYDGHEVAVHTLTHPHLPELEDEEVIRQVELDRLNLSDLVKYEVKGMAYPGGGDNCNEHVAELIKNNTGIKYSRTTKPTKSFEPYKDLYLYKPTLHHHAHWEDLFDMGRKFIELKTDSPKVFYIWGHSFEFDIFPERWEMFEEFCKMVSGCGDVFYGTNLEVLTTKWF